ncbi:MAG: ankyrin-3-like [Rickettsiaceae bacterium]|jgi:ankyrin repeat protein|nr:ankyrin-3-like [Rickettsiaceae bacterium]
MPNLDPKRGHRALLHAAQNGNLAAIISLAEAGIDINSQIDAKDVRSRKASIEDKRDDGKKNRLVAHIGETALHIAVRLKFIHITRHLIYLGANLDIQDYQGNTPLHLVVLDGDMEAVIDLNKAGADLNARNKNGNAALHFAVLNNHEEMVKYLLKAGANYDLVDNGKYSPLHSAASVGNLKIFETLHMAGANIYAKSGLGETTMHLAAQQKEGKDILNYLLRFGVEVDVKDSNGYTPTHWATYNNNSEGFETLHAKGANPDAEDEFDRTALHLAAIEGYEEMVDCLLKAKADPFKIDAQGFTALDYARNGGHLDIAKYLEEFMSKQDEEIKNEPSTTIKPYKEDTAILQAIDGRRCDRI